MGAVKSWFQDQLEYESDLCEMAPRNIYGDALDIGSQIQGSDNDFVLSCTRFYKRRGYLTERQMSALKRDPRKYLSWYGSGLGVPDRFIF